MNSLKIILFILISLSFCDLLYAQITIDGTITDSELNPISNALVEIVEEGDTSNYYSTTTDEAGSFIISNIYTAVDATTNNLPSNFIVLRNYPNPFNPSTIIYFELPQPENIEIKIYDILGREVRTLFNNFHKAGVYQMIWDGRNNFGVGVSAGVYLCRLKTKDNFKVHKMVLLDGGSSFGSVSNTKVKKSQLQNISKVNSIFNFSIKISGNSVLETDIKYLTCSSDTTLDLIVPKILQTVTIGSEGGKLETEDFSLTVPEGAFAESVTLNLGIDTDSISFEDETFSKLFRIDGLPEFYLKDLPLKIKLQKQPTDSISFAVGGIDSTFFNAEEFIDYDYYSAKDSSGYAVANLISPFTNNLGLLKSDNSLKVTNSTKLKKYFIALTSPGVVLSSNGNFIIYYPKSKALLIPEIDTYLEDAVDVIKSLGFYKLPIRTSLNESNWPIIVKFSTFSEKEPFNKFKGNLSGAQFGSYKEKDSKYYLAKEWQIIIHSNMVDEIPHIYLQRTLGRNVFINFIEQNSLFTSMDMGKYFFLSSLMWWSEKLFPNDENYITTNYDYDDEIFNQIKIEKKWNYILELLNGIVFNPSTINTISRFWHDLPFSALVEYLSNNTEKKDKIIFDIYNSIISHKSSVGGLIHALNETENVWWPNFFKEFIQGNIYNVPSKEFLDNISETIEFNDGDTLKYTDETYNDLSAKLFKININSEKIKYNKNLNFKIGPESLNLDYVKALVFGITGDSLVFISEGIDFLVGNLHKYDALLACVVNSGNEPPYDGTSKIDLDIRTIDSNLPFEGSIQIICRVVENLHYKSEEDEYDIIGSDSRSHNWMGKVKLINDSTYWGSWDEDDQIGYHHKGEMTVIIDPETKNLKFFKAEEIKDGDLWSVIDEKIISYNMDYSYDKNYSYRIYYRVGDNSVCNVINTLEYTQGNEGWNQTLTSFFCNENSVVTIDFNFDLLN